MFANSSGSDSVETHRGSRKVLHQDGCFVTGTVSWSDLNMTHTENIVGVVNPETSCLRLFDLHAGDNHPLITICYDGSEDVLTMQYARLGSISEDSGTSESGKVFDKRLGREAAPGRTEADPQQCGDAADLVGVWTSTFPSADVTVEGGHFSHGGWSDG